MMCLQLSGNLLRELSRELSRKMWRGVWWGVWRELQRIPSRQKLDSSARIILNCLYLLLPPLKHEGNSRHTYQRGRKVVKSGGAKNPGGEASVHVP